jgi:hypothetical protein
MNKKINVLDPTSWISDGGYPCTCNIDDEYACIDCLGSIFSDYMTDAKGRIRPIYTRPEDYEFMGE